MINAGIKIPTAQPDIGWNNSSKEWENIIIEVVYIQPQTSTDNPVSSGDILIDQEPKVFKVTSATHYVGNKFRINIKCISHEPTIQSNIKINTQRGLISTPNSQGHIAPYWDSTIVDVVPFRMAMIYNFNINQLSNIGGASTILQLSDTPSLYGLPGSILSVNDNRNSFEYKTLSGLDTRSYKVTINSGDNGTVFPSGTFDVHHGSNLNLQISPNVGYEIDKIIIDGSNITPTSSYTITNIVRDTVTSIIFKSEAETPDGSTSTKFGLVNINNNRSIAIGYNHVISISTDGKLYVSGDNTFGQLGIGTTTLNFKLYGIGVNSIQAMSYIPITSINSVFAAYNSSAAIDVNGNVFVWGENNFKKFGIDLDDKIKSPHKLDIPFTCRQVGIGPSYTVLVGTNNKMYFCGFYSASTQDIKFNNYVEVIVPGDVYEVSCSNSIIMVRGNFLIDGVRKYILRFFLNSPLFDQSNLCRYHPANEILQYSFFENIGCMPMNPTKYSNGIIFDDPRDDFFIVDTSKSILYYSGTYPPLPGKTSTQTFMVYDAERDRTGKRIQNVSIGEGIILVLINQPSSNMGITFNGRIYIATSGIDSSTNCRSVLSPVPVDDETGQYLTVNGSHIQNIKNVVSYYNRAVIVRSNGAMQMIYRKSLFESLTMKYIT